MLRIKRVHSAELREEVYALRYRAYRRQGAIQELPGERFCDAYDAQPNHALWALSDHEKLVGSIRTTWYDPAEPWTIPEMDCYAADVARVVPVGARMLSGNRFVTDPDRPDRDSSYAMFLLRFYMVVAKSRAEHALAAVRVNHLPFYRRVLKLERVSEGRVYPGLTSVMYLTACDFQQNIDHVYSSTPLLRPRGYERLFMDENYRDVWEIGLPVEV